MGLLHAGQMLARHFACSGLSFLREGTPLPEPITSVVGNIPEEWLTKQLHSRQGRASHHAALQLTVEIHPQCQQMYGP